MAWRRHGSCRRHLPRCYHAIVLSAHEGARNAPMSCAASPDRMRMARRTRRRLRQRWPLVMIYARIRGAESGPGYYVVSPLCAGIEIIKPKNETVRSRKRFELNVYYSPADFSGAPPLPPSKLMPMSFYGLAVGVRVIPPTTPHPHSFRTPRKTKTNKSPIAGNSIHFWIDQGSKH